MNTIEILRQQEQGLTAQLAELREQEKALLRASGIEEEAVKADLKAKEYDTTASNLRKDIAAVKDKKAQALASSVEKIVGRMSRVIPKGTPHFSVNESGEPEFGWDVNGNGVVVPYSGLSGGQRSMFDAALAFALLEGKANPVIIMEAAEVGPELVPVLKHLAESNPDAQVFVNTCFDVDTTMLEGWNVRNIDSCEVVNHDGN